MAQTKTGTTVPSSKRGPERAWFIYKYLNPASAEDPQTSFIAGWNRAYKESILDQTEFSMLVPLMMRLLALYEDQAVERDAIRSLGEVLE